VSASARPIDVESLLRRYEVVLLDAYGVLVHSGGALPGAAHLIDTLNAAGKPYYVLTHDASKLPASGADRASADVSHALPGLTEHRGSAALPTQPSLLTLP
jgi:hypothetical protein